METSCDVEMKGRGEDEGRGVYNSRVCSKDVDFLSQSAYRNDAYMR